MRSMTECMRYRPRSQTSPSGGVHQLKGRTRQEMQPGYCTSAWNGVAHPSYWRGQGEAVHEDPFSMGGMPPDGDSEEKQKFGKVPVVARRFAEDVRCCPRLRPSRGCAARMAGEAEPMGRQTKRGLNTEVPNPQQKPAYSRIAISSSLTVADECH